MTVQIHKITLYVGQQSVELPKGAEVISCQSQHDVITVWYECYALKPRKARYFEVVGTGMNFEKTPAHKHIGTCIMDGGHLIWHVYEVVK